MAIISISDSQINSADQVLVADASSKIPAKDGSQITILNATNVASGTIATARLDTGTTANKIVVLDGSGNLPVVDGSQLTGVVSATVSASDPTISTNPSAGLGAEWNNSTSGEMFICTDATAGANVWTNVGAGTGDIEPWAYQGTQYGFASGGYGNAQETHIEKFSFTSDGNSTDLADLLTGRIYAASSKSTTHGYLAGGDIGNYSTNVISKFAFVSTVNATDVGDITTARRMGGGTTSQTHGYMVSGSDLDKIDKWAHASDGNATLIGGVYEPRAECGSHSSSTHGYISGGQDASNNFLNSIEKHPFATDSDSVDSANLVTSTYRGGMGTGSLTHGYHFGGFDASAARTDQIQKFPYASDTNATDIANLTVGSRDGAASASSSYGYKYGGDVPPSGGATNVIEKFSTTSDANATDVGDLIEARYAMCGGHGY